MEVSKIFIWLPKIAFWATTTLLAIGVYMTRSPWWLVGFGLFGLASLSIIAKCQMSLSAVFSLLLCDIYFLVAFGKIVSDKSSSAWWLIIALILEAIFVGYAQEKVEEEEKKSKIARETEKRFAEKKKKISQSAKEDVTRENGSEAVESENVAKMRRKTLGENETKGTKNISDISDKVKGDDNFEKPKMDKNNHKTKEYLDENVATICEAFNLLTNKQLCCIILNRGSSKDDVTIATDLLTKRNALELLSQINKQ